VVLWHIQGFPAMPGQKFGPAWFPGLVAAGLAICGVLLVFSGLRQRSPWATLPDWVHSGRARAGVAAFIAGLVAYILVVDAVGFYLTGIVLLGLWLRVLGASWRITAIVALVGTIVIHLAFYKGLRIPLPWGLLERWAF
jgi:putative tricarboxylic transport membrane protein